MTTLDKQYPELLGEGASPDRLRLIAELDRASAAWRLPYDRDQAIALLLYERAETQMRRPPSRWPSFAARSGLYRVGVGLVTTLVMGGLYLTLVSHPNGGMLPGLLPSTTTTAFAGQDRGGTTRDPLATGTLVQLPGSASMSAWTPSPTPVGRITPPPAS